MISSLAAVHDQLGLDGVGGAGLARLEVRARQAVGPGILELGLVSAEVQGLTVLVAGEAPEDVLSGGEVHALLQVMEGVLRDEGHAQVRVPPGGTRVRRELADDEGRQRGLAGPVRAHDAHAAPHGGLHGGTAHRRAAGAGVGVPGVLEVEQAPAPRAHSAGQRPRLGQREGGERILVRRRGAELRLGVTDDELREGPLVAPQLAILHMDDVAADPVQEGRVVRHDQHGHTALLVLPQRLDEVRQPVDVRLVHVPCWLVQEEHVGLLQQRADQAQLHPPAAAQRLNRLLEPAALEAQAAQLLGHVLRREAPRLDLRVGQEVLQRELVALGRCLV